VVKEEQRVQMVGEESVSGKHQTPDYLMWHWINNRSKT